jgi:hypothetical protein
MRVILAVFLFLLPTGALAHHSQCPVVQEESHNRITCTARTGAYELDYHNSITYRLVRWSGQYQDLLRTLCREAPSIIETMDGRIIRTVDCQREVAGR